MPDATEVSHSGSADAVPPPSNLSSRVSALEAKVKELEERKPGRLGGVGILIGVIATCLALPPAFLKVKDLLFPNAQTSLKQPNVEMQYDPASIKLTLRVGIAATNEGNQPDYLGAPEASLKTPDGKGKELHARDNDLVLYDERNLPLKPPIIVNPGSTNSMKMLVSSRFTYSQSDAVSDPTEKVLQISFPREKEGNFVKAQVCFKLDSTNLEEASPSGYGLSSSDCAQR